MAAAPVAHVLGFPRGVVKEGAADTRRTDELALADGYDIGPRGAIIAARDVANYVTINDLAGAPAPWSKLYGLRSISGNNFTKQIAVGEGVDGATLRYLAAQFLREGAASPVGGGTDIQVFGAPIELGAVGAVPAPTTQGVQVTLAQFAGVFAITNPAALVNVTLVNIGAREGYAAGTAPGLYAILTTPPATDIAVLAISTFDSLGTGGRGEFATGTLSKQLRFRGVAAYNTFAMGWGYDYVSVADTEKEGPARLMFSNLGKPLKWGNDNVAAAGGNRAFSDTDAIPIGDAGEIIRAGLSWNKQFWIGTDKQMHYLAGYGRDSFVSDGANPVAKAENVIGPHCLIEGPNKNLFGMGENGLWEMDSGANFERHHTRLRDFRGQSRDWWDLIWNERLRGDAYPGKTNADLVWMATDWENEMVIIGIPWCNATAGYGYGVDTVVIKFNVRTGGFTRQVFEAVQYTAADYMRRQRQYGSTRMYGTATSGQSTIKKYGEKTASSGTIANPLPSMQTSPYSLFGPDGAGVYKRMYLTLAWEPDSEGATSAWVTRASAADEVWYDVCYDATVGLFVAVSDGTIGVNGIMTSPDGITWTARTQSDAKQWRGVVRDTGHGYFVAVSNRSGGTSRVMRSVNGTSGWTGVAPAADYAWVGVLYAPTLAALGRLVAFDGALGTTDRVMTSDDGGATWTLQTTPNTPYSAGCWSPDRSEFLLVGLGGANSAATSPDGVTWTAQTMPAHIYHKVCWASWLNLYVAVWNDGAGAGGVSTSPDGITWTDQTPASSTIEWEAITAAEDIELLVAVSRTGTGNRIMVSVDAVVWTSVSSPADNNWYAVTFGAGAGRFVAVGQSGVGDRVMTSDATTAPATLQFRVTPTVDDESQSPFDLYIGSTAPSAPADGDVWVDTSGTDTSLGNATAGTLVAAEADYIVKLRYRGAWQYTGFGGQKGQRVTVPMAFRRPKRGTRCDVKIDTIAANRRWQFEGLGFKPAPVTNAQ